MMPPKETRCAEGRGRPEENRARTPESGLLAGLLCGQIWRGSTRQQGATSTRFTALLHHVDVSALERAFRPRKRNAAPGVDGETVASYEQELAQSLK
jgi:RNA-directed DNA polymerase